MDKKVIAWWSGGITSAVACKIAIDIYGIENVRVIMIDTKNEHEDTYRFKIDCEKWYGANIETITEVGVSYESIQDVWIRHKSLNVAHGAICSTQLKRKCRENFQKDNDFEYQVFGFEFDKKEFNRATSLKLNHPKAKSIYPLLMMGYDKDDCLKVVEEAGIDIPEMYKMGFRNNNCFGTGCVQGGIGYWQKMKIDFPEKFNKMAEMEHKLTQIKGEPVTMLKDQGGDAKRLVSETGIKWNAFIFLKKNEDYPSVKSIDEMPIQEVKPLFECNGFCGVNDLSERSTTENEINYSQLDIFNQQ
jgi:3'-phosphoadenosine 5'-phosphosulfate sulfotransferase (PAPS reductase)/FAD synthetase